MAEEQEQREISISETPGPTTSPWLAMWVRPGRTIRRVVESNPGQHIILLAMAAGIAEGLREAMEHAFGDLLSFGQILPIILVAGPFAGLFWLFVGGAILRWIGSLLGGKATAREVRAAIGWSLLPRAVSLILWVPRLALLGPDLFTSDMPRHDTLMDTAPLLALAQSLCLLGTTPLRILLELWTLPLLAVSVSEVHRFSIWRSIATLFIPYAVLIAIGLIALILVS